MAITLDTTLGTLLDDPQAKAVLDQYLPGISSNPLAAMAKGMSLKMILCHAASGAAWPDPGKGRGDPCRDQQESLAATIPRSFLGDDDVAKRRPTDGAFWCSVPEATGIVVSSLTLLCTSSTSKTVTGST